MSSKVTTVFIQDGGSSCLTVFINTLMHLTFIQSIQIGLQIDFLNLNLNLKKNGTNLKQDGGPN